MGIDGDGTGLGDAQPLAPVKKVARMLMNHLAGLPACFRHCITNAATEGLNSKIQAIKAAARGF